MPFATALTGSQLREHHQRDRFHAVVSRIKLISGLDIAERRLPQDGRFSIRTAGVDTDVRVSVIPGVHGESLVLRLLPNTQTTRFDLNNLGIEPDHLALMQPDGAARWHRTGHWPDGFRKSTTLYATLVAVIRRMSVLTVEDPVEYRRFRRHPVSGTSRHRLHLPGGTAFGSCVMTRTPS